MNKVRNKEYKALLKKVSEIFDEADNVFGIDGEESLAIRIVPDAKEYISETIDDPEARQWPTPSRRFNTSGLISGRDSATTASNNEQSIKPVVVRIVFP